jgi:hypothetical protein
MSRVNSTAISCTCLTERRISPYTRAKDATCRKSSQEQACGDWAKSKAIPLARNDGISIADPIGTKPFRTQLSNSGIKSFSYSVPQACSFPPFLLFCFLVFLYKIFYKAPACLSFLRSLHSTPNIESQSL